jgi:hypothetical protein
MTESEIQYVMFTEKVSRYYAIKILELMQNQWIRDRIIAHSEAEEYREYINQPFDPRD